MKTIGVRRFLPPLLLFLTLLIPVGELHGQVIRGDDPVSDTSHRSDPLPPTREEWLRKRREAQRQEATPPPQDNTIQKYLKELDQKSSHSVEDVNFWGFYPRLDWIARGSGAALGLRYWNPDAIGPLDIMGSAFYSRRRYQHYDLQLGLIPNRGKRIPPRQFETEGIEELGDFRQERFSRFRLYGNFRWRDLADESFYGFGTGSLKDSRARYRLNDTLAEMVTGYQFTPRIGYTLRLGFLGHALSRPRSSPGIHEKFPGQALPGLSNPPNYFVLRNALLLDYRDHPGIPHRGFLVALGWDRFDNQTGNDLFNFNRYGADLRGYIPIRSRQQVIALRGFFVNSDPGPGNRVPFFLQPSLGGGESLRGYDADRFQGDKLMLLQAEYRWEASRLFELAFFGDTGTVSNQGERLDLDRLRSDAGIGFRIKSTESTLFRLDIASGNEGTKFQFRFSQAF